MIGNIYKHKASGACFRIVRFAHMDEGNKSAELLECGLVAKTGFVKPVRFLLDKQWFLSAELDEFEKLLDAITVAKNEISKIVRACYELNALVLEAQWSAFDSILYEGLFLLKQRVEISAREVYEYFNPQHNKNGNNTNT